MTALPLKQELATRAKRLLELGVEDYTAYVKSPTWRQTRARYWVSDMPKACICGGTESLVLHHKTYARLGAERLSDLQVLCQRCHVMVHDLCRRGDITLDGALRLVSASRAERATADRQRKDAIRVAERAAWNEQHWLIRLRDMRREAQSKRIDIRNELRFIRRLADSGKSERHLDIQVIRLREKLDRCSSPRSPLTVTGAANTVQARAPTAPIRPAGVGSARTR